MKKLALLTLCISLAGCSTVAGTVGSAALGAVTGGDSGLAVDTEVTAGDKNQSVELGKQTKSETKLDDVTVKEGGTMNVSSTTKGQEQSVNASSAQAVTVNSGVTFWQSFIGKVAIGLICYLSGVITGMAYLMYEKLKGKSNE